MKSRERSRSRKRRRSYKWITFAVAAAVLCLFAPKAKDWSQEKYRVWKRDRALEQAQRFFAADDFQKAAVAIQIALSADRQSPVVWRTIADMSDKAGAREAIFQRQQVALLTRGALDDQLALALTALRFNDLFTARDALTAVPESQRSTVAYRRVSALYAMVEGSAGVAETLLASLLKTDKSDALRISHATMRMSNPDAAIAATARQELAGMTQNPKLAPLALRELFGDAILRSDWTAARAWADRMVELPSAAFEDHLALATLKLLRDKKPFLEVVPPLLEMAKAKPENVVSMVRWLHAQKQVKFSRDWLDSLPEKLRSDPLVQASRLEIAFSMRDWAGAGELLHEGAAGPLPDEALRFAMEARSAGEVSGPAARFAKWEQALAAARGNLGAYRILYRLTVAWKWEPEAEALLLVVAQGFPGQTWAHEALVRVYQAQLNGPALRKVLTIWQQQQPMVARLQNDWALMDMLVEPTQTWNRAKQVAEELHKNERAAPNYATTCAFAYAQAGRPKDALAVVEKMKPDERRYPPRAPYLAFIYAEAGKPKEARAQLELARPYRPYKEETRLMEQALARIEKDEKAEAELRRLTGAGEAPGAPVAPKKDVVKP